MLRTRLILSGSKTRLEKTLKKSGATTSAASQPAPELRHTIGRVWFGSP
jgi:hypothetical protein